MQNGEVLPGRDCESCTVCCVALTIDDPALQKVQGYRCKHLRGAARCGIYAARPATCRTFECGWRLLKWVRPGLRPDRSGVLIRLYAEPGANGAIVHGIAITLLDRAAVKADGLAETVAAAVNAGVPVMLDVPGPPGHTAAQARLNEALAVAVAARDKPAVLDTLRRARLQGLRGPSVPIRLVHAPDPHDGAARPVGTEPGPPSRA